MNNERIQELYSASRKALAELGTDITSSSVSVSLYNNIDNKTEPNLRRLASAVNNIIPLMTSMQDQWIPIDNDLTTWPWGRHVLLAVTRWINGIKSKTIEYGYPVRPDGWAFLMGIPAKEYLGDYDEWEITHWMEIPKLPQID